MTGLVERHRADRAVLILDLERADLAQVELQHRVALPDQDFFEREVTAQVANLLAQAAIAERVIDGEEHAFE